MDSKEQSGPRVLSFASKRLPELRHCLKQDFSSVPQDQFHDIFCAARKAIGSEDDNAFFKAQGGVSLTVLTEVIIVFLWITLASDMDEQIASSIAGLRKLYIWLAPNGRYRGVSGENPIINTESMRVKQMALVFSVLSGLSDESKEQTSASIIEPPSNGRSGNMCLSAGTLRSTPVP